MSSNLKLENTALKEGIIILKKQNEELLRKIAKLNYALEKLRSEPINREQVIRDLVKKEKRIAQLKFKINRLLLL